ncbi:ATP-binding protein [Rhizobium sp. RAF56]|uniref:ATP-binding protein n=1 Tax=Rhizobium sp. RAF56 TaxID=3233062 RepID=UPI003F98F53B
MAAVFTMLACVVGVVSYLSASRESNEFLDLQQRQIARYVGDLTFVAPGDAALPPHDPEDDYLIEVTYSDGRPAKSSDPTIVIPDQPHTGFSEFDDERGRRWRVFSMRTPGRVVQVAQQIMVRHELAADAALRAILPFALAVPLSWVIVSLIVGRVFRRLQRSAAEVAARDPGDHSPIRTEGVPQDVMPFVLSINTLLGHLRKAIVRQRVFLSDAAHELRTPLAALTIQIGNLRTASSGTDLDQRLVELQSSVRRASSLTTQLLRIARYDSLELPSKESVRLDELAKEVVSSLLALADDKGIDIGFTRLEAVEVIASVPDVRTLLEILIDNSIRYTEPGGSIDISVVNCADGVRLAVVDTGPGVDPNLLHRLTERFFRGPGVKAEGSGLGLAIARSIAERHGLVLRVSNRPDGAGFASVVEFASASH